MRMDSRYISYLTPNPDALVRGAWVRGGVPEAFLISCGAVGCFAAFTELSHSA